MLALNSQTKTLFAVAAVLAVIFFLYNRNGTSVQNGDEVDVPSETSLLPENIEAEDELEGFEAEDMSNDSNSTADSEASESEASAPGGNGPANGNGKYNNIPIPREDMVKYFPQRDYAPPESDWLQQKFNSRNKSKRGFKRSSYSGGMRGDLGPSDWEAYFDHNNNVVGNSQTGENDNFMPIDESSGGLAVFKSNGRATCGSNQNCEPEDLFDVDKYLPQEVNDDWFEVQPEPISVKNRHLINITKPIGINTIGTSLKNASWDIRGTPAGPKFAVSPWLNSSIEVDTNLKPLL